MSVLNEKQINLMTESNTMTRTKTVRVKLLCSKQCKCRMTC